MRHIFLYGIHIMMHAFVVSSTNINKGTTIFFEKSTEHVVFVVLWNFIVKDLNFACNDALWEFFFTMKFHTNCFTRKFIKMTWEFIFSSMYLISLKYPHNIFSSSSSYFLHDFFFYGSRCTLSLTTNNNNNVSVRHVIRLSWEFGRVII